MTTSVHIYSKCRKLGSETAENLYSHTHTHTHTRKAVCEHEDTTVLWNGGVQTERFWSIGQT